MLDFVTLDMETFYDADYSLKKLTTEEYINDPRFEVIGVGLKFMGNKSHWFHHHEVDWALRLPDWSKVALIAHNAKFDAAILAWKYGIKPAFVIDTMSMARPFHNSNVGCSLGKLAEYYQLGVKGVEVVEAKGKRLADFTPEQLAQYGEYCKTDCNLTFDLFNCLRQRLPISELRLIDMTIRMYTQPCLCLDTETIQREIDLENDRKSSLLALVDQPKSCFSSNDKFAEFLSKLGITPPTKPSGKRKNPDGSPKMVWAFAKSDADFIALQDHDDPLVSAAVEVRLGIKSTQRETRAARFMGIAQRTGGMLPVPLGYYNAHTGRYGGEESINLQNLQRTSNKDPDKGLLRMSITADEGELLVVEDLSQIEARLLVWQANQLDRVEAFAQKRDVYSEQASVIYGRHVDRKKNKDDFVPGFIGKAVVLGCGFGLGFLKFASMIYVGMLGEKGIKFDGGFVQALDVKPDSFVEWIKGKPEMYERMMDKRPMMLTPLDWHTHVACAQSIINSFRNSAPQIVKYWDTANQALGAMMRGDNYEFGGPTGRLLRVEGTSIILPNGMPIRYEGLEQDSEGQYSFLRRKEGRIQRVKTYGGSVVENCVAEGALVLTERGWKPIEAVGDELVHDGIDFVQHGGVVFKSIQPCVNVNGVSMTPDHEVLTDEGWKEASQLQRPNRPSLWRSHNAATIAHRWEEMALDASMPVRERGNPERFGSGEGRKEKFLAELRMYVSYPKPFSKFYAWHEQASRVLGLEKHARQMQTSFTSGLEKLRGAWDNGVRRMGSVLREFLARHGADIPQWAYAGTHGQQSGIQPTELRMAYPQAAGSKHPRHDQGSGCSRSGGEDWIEQEHDLLPIGAWLDNRGIDTLSQSSKPTYDILNCGPRNRFVVLGTDGPFVVHNCTQALARIIITDAMLETERQAKCRIALQVHDEAVAVTAAERAKEVQSLMRRIMQTPPAWAAGLPLDSEGDIAFRYGDAK